MKKGLTEIIFILDRSGSMAGLEKDTIGGFNSLLERQKREEGEAVLSTVLFDHECQVLHDRVDLQRVPPMTGRDYFVRGCTALLDAVGGAIHHIGNVQHGERQQPLHPGAGEGDGGAAAGALRLGIPLPGGQHRRGGNRRPYGHRPPAGGQLLLRRGGHPAQL